MLSVVGEIDGRVVMFTGARVVLEIGCRIDETFLENQAAVRDVCLEGFAKLAAQAKKKGYYRMVCSVTSPTPKWVNFLKKRLGFRGYDAEFLALNLDKEWP
jgi:hypothetical protein